MALPGGRGTYLPGPGGGLLYVQFDNGTFMGVSPKDLIREGSASSAMEDAGDVLAAMLGEEDA